MGDQERIDKWDYIILKMLSRKSNSQQGREASY